MITVILESCTLSQQFGFPGDRRHLIQAIADIAKSIEAILTRITAYHRQRREDK